MFNLKKITLLMVLASAAVALTGCASPRPPKPGVDPLWTYRDKPDNVAFNEVWYNDTLPVERIVAALEADE